LAKFNQNSPEEKTFSMYRTLIFLTLLLVCLLPIGSSAQTQPSFASLTADLWPEFDKPTMLVMYQITLSPQARLPAEIRLRIPASAGVPNAVANCQPDGRCFDSPYEQQRLGEWLEVSFQATSPDLRVEYYDPALTKEGSKRHYEYTWPGDYAVENFNIQVQQPAGSENMYVKPGTFTATKDGDDLTYHSLDVGPVPAGQTVQVVVEYDKNTDTLSNSNMPVQPSEPLSSETAGRASLTLSSALPIALGLVGLGLIIGGGVWYWRSGRQKPQPANSRRTRRRSGSAPVASGAPEGNVYCHQCGKRAAPGDRFCRTCGTQLRVGG
jgi:ribosomal protein L32